MSDVDACSSAPPPNAGLTPAPLVVSLASSDPACAINRTLQQALGFLAPTTRLLLHVGCGSPATPEERRLLGAIPRVLLNPTCAWVNRGDGSILLAHLLNMRLLAAAPPEAVLLASADMRWLAHGVEAAATSRVSSALDASYIGYDGAIAAIAPRQRAAFARSSFAADLRAVAAGAAGRLFVQKHEGSFYPWPVLRAFVGSMCSRGSLRRLPEQRAVELRPVLSLAPEEVLLPTFAAARLNGSGSRRGSVAELDETLDAGVLCGFAAEVAVGKRRRRVPVRVCGATGEAPVEEGGRARRWRACVGSLVFARKAEGDGAHRCGRRGGVG